MKLALIQVTLLTALVGLFAAIARDPVVGRWGAAGQSALFAAAVVCWGGAVVAAVPLGVVATYRPAWVAQAAFAGTAVRMLVTGGLVLGYQLLVDVHLTAFLLCLLIGYLILLAAETGLAVVLIRRALVRPAAGGE